MSDLVELGGNLAAFGRDRQNIPILVELGREIGFLVVPVKIYAFRVSLDKKIKVKPRPGHTDLIVIEHLGPSCYSFQP